MDSPKILMDSERPLGLNLEANYDDDVNEDDPIISP